MRLPRGLSLMAKITGCLPVDRGSIPLVRAIQLEVENE